MCDLIPCNNLPIYLQNVSIKLTPSEWNVLEFATVSLLPTVTKQKRLWEFQMSFIHDPTSGSRMVEIEYDFKNVVFEGTASFESPITGVLANTCRLYNASKYMTYTFDIEKKILTITVILPKQAREWSYTIQIYDSVLLKWDL